MHRHRRPRADLLFQPLPLHVTYAPTTSAWMTRGSATTGVGDEVQWMSVTEPHLHDQPHRQPLEAVDSFTAAGLLAVYGAAWLNRERRHRSGKTVRGWYEEPAPGTGKPPP